MNPLDPKEIDTEAKELNKPFLQAWWISRIQFITNAVLLLAVLALASGYFWLLPLKETKFTLLTGYNKDTQVIQVEPIEKTSYGLTKLMEIFSKAFVIDLHTIDGQTEAVRLKKLSLMATDEVQEFIESQLNMENNHAIAKKIFSAGVTRSVHIKRVTNLAPDAPNTWQIEWDQLDYDTSENVQRKNHFISTLMAESQHKTFNSDEEQLNPIGYTVMTYSLRIGNDD